MSRVEDDQLTDGERGLLALAVEHLRAAVVEYQFVTETVDRVRIERAQVAVASAEGELWCLRASLLRWQRQSCGLPPADRTPAYAASCSC